MSRMAWLLVTATIACASGRTMAAASISASVGTCSQFAGYRTDFCPAANAGSVARFASDSGAASASVGYSVDELGYAGATTSHSGTAFGARGIAKFRSDIVVNAQFEYPNRLGGWTSAGVSWSDTLHTGAVAGFDLPFDLSGGFDWSVVTAPAGGATAARLAPQGKLQVDYLLVPQNAGGARLFDSRVFDFSDPGTAFSTSINFQIRGLQPQTDYYFLVSTGFTTYLGAGGCPSTATTCIAHASASGDFSHTIRMRAATLYDEGGNLLAGGLGSQSGYDYLKDAVDTAAPVPEPGTALLTPAGLAITGLLIRRRRGRKPATDCGTAPGI